MLFAHIDFLKILELWTCNLLDYNLIQNSRNAEHSISDSYSESKDRIFCRMARALSALALICGLLFLASPLALAQNDTGFISAVVSFLL